ncbi:MAG: hypothetical protein WKF71_12550 [Pyrinomonadaceae bacterium]
MPLHDDLFDFFYEALPGYEKVGQTTHSARLLGFVSTTRTFAITNTRIWTNGASQMFVTPGVIVDGKAVTHNLVDINVNMRILLGKFVLRRLGKSGNIRQNTTRSAIRLTSCIRGIRRRRRNRRNAISTVIIRG